MDKDRNILDKIDHKAGFTVPDGYFHKVREKIIADLPEYPREEKAPDLSIWQRVKPYIYMAAMFAGIWCMMKMFHMMTSDDFSFDNPPEAVALAMAEYAPSDFDYSVDDDNTGIFDLENDLSEEYSSIEDFARDFNATSTINEID